MCYIGCYGNMCYIGCYGYILVFILITNWNHWEVEGVILRHFDVHILPIRQERPQVVNIGVDEETQSYQSNNDPKGPGMK